MILEIRLEITFREGGEGKEWLRGDTGGLWWLLMLSYRLGGDYKAVNHFEITNRAVHLLFMPFSVCIVYFNKIVIKQLLHQHGTDGPPLPSDVSKSTAWKQKLNLNIGTHHSNLK